MVRYSFPVRLFHSLLHAGLSRRSDVPFCTGCAGLFASSNDSVVIIAPKEKLLYQANSLVKDSLLSSR